MEIKDSTTLFLINYFNKFVENLLTYTYFIIIIILAFS